MKLSKYIWNELGALAVKVDRIDHDDGNVFYRPEAIASDKASIAAIVAAHDPLSVPAEELAKEAQRVVDITAIADAKLDAVIQYLVTHTPDECAQYVESNVTDLASAKAFLKIVAKALSVLARRELR